MKGNDIKLSCPIRKKCSGCQLSNLTYQEQLKMKQAKVGRLLHDFGRIKPVIGMEVPFRYRNKAYGAFGFVRGKIISGIYQSKDGHIVATDDCLLEDEAACQIIKDIRNICIKLKITSYDAYRKTGFLRHVLIRNANATGEILVSITGATPDFPHKTAFVEMLTKMDPDITTIVFGYRKSDIALHEADNQEILYGDGYITDRLCGLSFRIQAQTFYQVNSQQTEILYNKAISLAELKGNETILDAYCGVGTIGLIASKNCKNVIGIESNSVSIENAKTNAQINKIKNAKFICQDAGQWLKSAKSDKVPLDVVFMDPPRQGADKLFLNSLIEASPKKIVYISCNPETLRRDLFMLRKKYHIDKIQPVDMFPFTNHVESVVLLTKVHN